MNEQDFLERAKMIEWLNSKKVKVGFHSGICEDPDYYGPCTCGNKEKYIENELIDSIKKLIMKVG